jgi:hypothetical protein
VKILFVGPTWIGSNALSMANGLLAAGHDVDVIDTSAVNRLTKFSVDWAIRKTTKRHRKTTLDALHVAINRAARTRRYDLLFCYKTIYLSQHLLLETPIPLKIHYSADDVSNSANTTSEYLQNESTWTQVVTTKKHNVSEIEKRGGSPLFVMSAYDPSWHYRQVTTLNSSFKLGFVGNFRPDRQQFIRELAQRYGSEMLVCGEGWKSDLKLASSGARIHKAVYGPEYSRIISSIEINLVLLNSDNRDTHTCRSFEVPASGGLFLGPRTEEHQLILADGRECLLYSSHTEFEEHLARLEKSPSLIREIADAGHKQIVRSSNTYADRAAEILQKATSAL